MIFQSNMHNKMTGNISKNLYNSVTDVIELFEIFKECRIIKQELFKEYEINNMNHS